MSTDTDGLTPIDFTHLGPAPGTRLVVIGSHGGIGAALTTRALEGGLEVMAFDTAAALAEHGEIPGANAGEIDVLAEESVRSAAGDVRSAWGEADAVVFVSGIGDADTPLLDYPVERWDRVHAVNLRGAFLAAQAFVPLIRRGSGSMVFIGSTVASQPPPALGSYSASKAGVVAFAKSLAKELAPGIRVNVVSPGITETAFMVGGSGQGRGGEPVSPEAWFGEEAYRRRLAMIPQGRLGNPDDVVGPTLFLLAPGARYVTGQTFHVNGGLFLP